MDDITWQDPPPNRAGRHVHDHVAIAERLKQRPGHWALILSGVSGSYATQIRRGAIAAYGPPGSFEATARKRLDDKKVDIYVRFVGEL